MPGNNSNTDFLYHANGDQGNTGHEVTIKGTSKIIDFGANRMPTFVNYSGWYNGSSGQWTTPNHANWDLLASASQDYTIDFVQKFTDFTGTETIIGQYEDANNLWVIENVSGTGLRLRVLSDSIADFNVTGTAISDDKFHDCSLIKITSGGPTVEWGLYVNGVQIAYLSNADVDSFTGILSGGALNSSNYFQGYNSYIRIYAGNPHGASPNVGLTDTIDRFTTIPSSDGNTYLQIKYEEITQGETPATFTDSGTNSHTITNVSSNVSGITFWWSGAWVDNGTTDYHTTPNHPDWDIMASTGTDATIQGWVKFDGSTPQNTMLMNHFDDAANYWASYFTNGDELRLIGRKNNVTVIDTSRSTDVVGEVVLHFAIIKVGTIYGVYINGKQGGYLADSSVFTLTGPLNIGSSGTGVFHDGWIGEISLHTDNIFSATPVVGLTDTFISPTQPTTPDANTSFSLQPSGNTAIGSTKVKDITFTDGIVLSQESDTGFGQSSLLDGTSDWIEESNPADFIQT